MRTTVCVHQNHKSCVRLIIGCLCSMPSVRWWVNIAILRMCLCFPCVCAIVCQVRQQESSISSTQQIWTFFCNSMASIFFYFVNAPFRVGIGGILMCELRRFPPVLSTKRHSHILQTMMLFSMSFAGLSIQIQRTLCTPCYYCSIVSRITIAFSYKL